MMGGGGVGGDTDGVDEAAQALALQEAAMAEDLKELDERSKTAAASVREEEEGEEEDESFNVQGANNNNGGAEGVGASLPVSDFAAAAAASSSSKPSAAAKTKKRERKRMSLIISAGGSTEVVLEVFAELGNSIARLRTTLITAVASLPASQRGSSAVLGGGVGSAASSSALLGGRLRGAMGGGMGGGAVGAQSRRDYTKALSRISTGLQTSLQVLDAIRSVEEPRAEVVALASLAGGGGGPLSAPRGGSPLGGGGGGAFSFSGDVNVNGGYTGGVAGGVGGGSAWYHYARRFRLDLESCRDQLIEIAMLVVDLTGVSASLEATSLVDKMVERMSFRVDDLSKSIEKGEQAEAKRREAKESALHDIADDRKIEAEKERREVHTYRVLFLF